MKIVYLSTSSIPSRTANSIHVMKMCQAFARIGHDVTLLAPDWKWNYEPNSTNDFDFYGVEEKFRIKKIYSPRLRGNSVIYLFGIIRYLMNNPVDLVYGRFLFGCYVSAFKGIPTIFESHDKIWQNKIEFQFFKRMVRSDFFVQLVVISQSLKNLYMKRRILASDKIFIAHDGADEPDNSAKLRSWPGRETALQVGYIGHLYPGRGIDLILELGKHLPDADFHIVGGHQKDIRYWEKKCKTPNVFFHGYVKHRVVHKYRNMCDVFLSPHQKQVAVFGGKGDISNCMSPLKIFEYMSSKKPVIASDLPVLREILNENNSIIVKSDDISAWKEAILSLNNTEKRVMLANAAYNDFIKNYTWSQRAINVLNLEL